MREGLRRGLAVENNLDLKGMETSKFVVHGVFRGVCCAIYFLKRVLYISSSFICHCGCFIMFYLIS